jgi:uncharacterized ion transporter superfamily protein YfcC
MTEQIWALIIAVIILSVYFLGKWYIKKVKREHDSNEAMSQEVERKERE